MHGAVYRFCHVIDGEGGDGNGREGFHFGAFGRHDASDVGGGEDSAFIDVASGDEGEGGGLHGDCATGDCGPLRDRFIAYIDHLDVAVCVYMGQFLLRFFHLG